MKKSIGFIDIVRKNSKKALVLLSKGKTVKKQEEKNKKCKIVIFSRENFSLEAILRVKIKKLERERSGHGFGPWPSHTRLDML